MPSFRICASQANGLKKRTVEPTTWASQEFGEAWRGSARWTAAPCGFATLRNRTPGPSYTNWLFKGSLAAGERAANLMTIIGSALHNTLDVRAYLEDILRRVLSGETNWEALAPHMWKAKHPESVREYRQEERRQAADRERTRRARRRLLR